MGLRARLLLLVLVPSVPALLLALYTDLEQRRYGLAKVSKEAMELVHVVRENQTGLLEGVQKHLAALSAVRDAYGTNYPRLQKLLIDIGKAFTDYAEVGIAETNGALVSSSLGPSGETNLAQRLELRRVLKTGEMAVGEYQSANSFCKACLPIGYPLLDHGRVVRVLYASLDVSALNRALSKAPLPPGVVAEVFDPAGHLVGRSADWEHWVGRSFQRSSLFEAMSIKGEGIIETNDPDGEKRLYAFAPLRGKEGANAYVSVGIPVSVAYAEARHLLVLNLAVLGGVALLALLVAWLYADRNVLRPIKALVGSTRKVAAGDLSARTGIKDASAEFEELVRSFDEMATNLEQQRVRTERAQAEIQRLNSTLEGRVTERTAQLAELNQQLEGFSYSVSHDLRAPLRHIAAFLALLQEEPRNSFTPESRQFFTNISAAVDRMNSLVEDLLAFARVSREEIRRERVAMSELVREVQREMKEDTTGRDIHWEIQTLPEVSVDRSMFKQVWANLLANAVKYTRERQHARISIGAQNAKGEVVFYVKDNGAGFDMKYASKLFGVFQRLHAPERFEGTGVGLANVQRIVLRHGGKIWAEGKVDHGATFWFSLPANTGN